MQKVRSDSNFIITLILISSILFFTLPAKADHLRIGIDDWCPYTCDPKKEKGKKGYLFDIVDAILQKQGDTLEVFFYPFTRNIRMVRSGKLDCLLGVYKGDVPDFVFPKTHQGIGINTFYVENNTPWRFTGINSLSQIKLGLIADYDYGVSDFRDYVNANPDKVGIMYGNNPLDRNIMKLQLKRIGAFVEDNQVAEYNLNKLGISDKIIEAGTLGNHLPVFIAFSPAIPDEKSQKWIKVITDGIVQLRESGELKTIMEKYGLKDWVK